MASFDGAALNPSIVAREEERPPRRRPRRWLPPDELRAYMREAKRRSRQTTRSLDPDYDRSPRRDDTRANHRRARP